MYNVVLTDIKWNSPDKSLPKELVYELTDEAARNWQEKFEDDMRRNKSNMIMLLKDVFQVESERKYGASISKCWLKSNLKFGAE